jgi:ATP-dependent DNA helicase DinG
MLNYFGPDGLLVQQVTGFEYRAAQAEMAQAIYECMSCCEPFMAEAGTGTGKTLAYLIPAISSGKRVVISTGTKTLQDQILDHDIPLLKTFIFPKLRAVCLKGRKNYLCRRRFRDFAYQPTLYGKEEAKLFRRFQSWASRTRTGDRAEISWLPDRFMTWNEVSSNSEQCLGQQCEDFPVCFLTRLREEASHADLLVVNHHLFFADLSLRDKGYGEIIPDYQAVVFDEAHQLEDTAGLYFGAHFSNLQLNELARDLMRESRRGQGRKPKLQEVQNIAQQLEVLSRLLHHDLSRSPGPQGRFPLDVGKAGNELSDTCGKTMHALEQLKGLLTLFSDPPSALESLCRRSTALAQMLRDVFEQRDSSLVYWYEISPQAVSLHGTPIEVSSILRDKLLSRTGAVVMTSATLSTGGSFEYVRGSLGLPTESRGVHFPSPFALDKQALIYVPARFPLPAEPAFCGQVAKQGLEILRKSRGRALFLFTSYRNMKEVHQFLDGRLPYPILVQGQKPKRALLAEFKEKIDSVLLATSSFWQGIDVPGEALSCLMIDKLPFEVPDDPVISARMEHISAQGKSAFFSYQVPRAIIQLKQGVGRLIRSSSDRGIIVIFDVRLVTKSYGRLFLKSLPTCRLVHELDEIDGFLESLTVEAEQNGVHEPKSYPNQLDKY